MKKHLLIILLMLFVGVTYSGDHSFSVRVEFTEKAINKALEVQYNQLNVPSVVSGSVPSLGINYTIYLSSPFIDLTSSLIRLNMPIRVETNFGNYEGIILRPSVSIPSSSISTDQVKAFLLDLPSKVQALDIPDWLKTVLVSTYNSYEPWMYPSKLIDQISTPFLEQRRVNITNLTLGWGVQAGKIVITLTTDVNSQLPQLWAAMDVVNGNGQSDYLRILSNIEVKVAHVVVEAFDAIRWQGKPNVTCPKGGNIAIDMGDIFDATTYNVQVVFKINETFYVREYGQLYRTFNGSYYGATKSTNN